MEEIQKLQLLVTMLSTIYSIPTKEVDNAFNKQLILVNKQQEVIEKLFS